MLFDINNIEDFYRVDVTADRLIHPLTTIVDFKFKHHSKEEILQRIQFWKFFLSNKNARKIMIHDHLSIDSIALLFACLEQSVTIYTCKKCSRAVLELSVDVDLVIIGRSCKNLYIDLPKYHLIDNIVNVSIDLPTYIPNKIDIQNLFLVGKTSGSTGTPKIIKHTARTFINASIISTFFFSPGKTFSAYPNINHIGMAAVMCCSPVLSGATIYSCSSLLDLLILSSRQIFDIIGIFSMQIESWQELEKTLDVLGNASRVDINFSRTEIITAGLSPGPTTSDWFFAKYGKRIRSFYGSNETLAPNFVIDIESPQYEFNKRNLGKSIPGTEYKIADDMLIVKNPGLSDFARQDNSWYTTGDYVTESNGQIFYKGRTKINDHYILDLHDLIHKCTFNDGVEMDHYLTRCENNKLNIYTKHQFVVDSVNANYEEIKKNINKISQNLSVECSIINDIGDLEIKSVPARNPTDYL